MDMDKILEQAEYKARTMKPAGMDIPLMTHDIEKEGCNGLADCPVCSFN